MSILNSFDNKSEEILKPEHVIEAAADFPEAVVVTFNQNILSIASAMSGVEKIGELNAGFPIPIYKISYHGKRIALYQTLIGGAGTAGLLEEVIAKGGKKFVFFGSCGTLDKELSAGHLIVPTAAYRDEGTSYHYAPPGDYINVTTAEKLSQILTELNLPYIQGKTWTTDAIYRETRNNMAGRKQEGCITVEMECASIMAVSQFRKKEAYQYIYTEDNLDSENWDPRTMGNVPQNDYEKYLRIALEIAVRI